MNLKCGQQVCKNKELRGDYGQYHPNKKEELLCILECLAFISVFAYFFYRSILPLISFAVVYPVYRKNRLVQLKRKRRRELTLQFKEMLNSLLGAIQAGYSLENAVIEACRDMEELYGRESHIVKELLLIQKGISNNQPIEKLFMDFGARSRIEDIDNFAGIIAIGKHYGGNINETMRETICTIDEKITVEQEIQTMLQSKVFELKIMEVIPFVMIFYIDITSKNYFQGMYHTPIGIMVMTFCLAAYLLSIYFARKIFEIHI